MTEPMPARWLNVRLVSLTWFWHCTHNLNPPRDAVCVHRRLLRATCEKCAEKDVPENYTVEPGYTHTF